MNRLQQILTAVLVVQLIVIGVLYFPNGSKVTSDDLLFDNITADQVASIKIEDHDKNMSLLTKQSDGTWVLSSGGDYPAKSESIDEIIGKILSITRSRLVTKTASSHERLEVAADNYIRRIEITLKDNTVHTLITGSSPGTKTTHVRLEGEDEVYLTSAFSNYDVNAPASNWIDTSYLKVDQESIAAATLTNASGTYEFTKVDGVWQMAGMPEGSVLNETNLTNLLKRISSLLMSSPVGKTDEGYGMDAPQATFTFTTYDENNVSKTYTLTIGDLVELTTSKYYAKSSESEYYVLINSTYLDAFVNYNQESFVTAESELTPTAEP